MNPYLVAPRTLPDGSVSWEEQKPEIAARIRDGDPHLGWMGEPRLSLVLNTTFAKIDPLQRGLPRWEVWRTHEDGTQTLVVHCVKQRIDGDQLIRQLAAHDSRTHDIAQELLDARGERRARVKADATEDFTDKADKLAFALGRDLDLPAQSGRLYPAR